MELYVCLPKKHDNCLFSRREMGLFIIVQIHVVTCHLKYIPTEHAIAFNILKYNSIYQSFQNEFYTNRIKNKNHPKLFV